MTHNKNPIEHKKSNRLADYGLHSILSWYTTSGLVEAGQQDSCGICMSLHSSIPSHASQKIHAVK
jgi:hypothetical protein